MADVDINLFKKIEENTTETDGFVDGYLIASIGGKVQGVDPSTLGGGGSSVFVWGFDFSDSLNLKLTFTAQDKLKITTIDNTKDSIPSVVLKVNGSAYTLGDNIQKFDDIEITVSAVGYVQLIGTFL